MFPSTDRTPQIIDITQNSKNTNISAFLRIPAFSAKAYVKMYLAIPNSKRKKSANFTESLLRGKVI